MHIHIHIHIHICIHIIHICICVRYDLLQVLNFSIAYGKTAHGLAKDWGVTKTEAQVRGQPGVGSTWVGSRGVGSSK